MIMAGISATLSLAGNGAPQSANKIVIAHRGASGYLPEHTLEAYAMAYAQGADYIEPDLVMTKDGRFVCLHDIYLEPSTNVEQVFPDRVREDEHWYAIDFTLAEIKQLHAHERLENRFPADKALFEVPTLEEMIELVQGLNKTTGRDVGVYPEMKEPEWHGENGLPMEAALVDVLGRYGYKGKDAKVFIQCFWPGPLVQIRNVLKSELPLIQLISDDEDSDQLVTEEGIAFVASYANGIGPDKTRIEANPALVEWAHKKNLVVHPYTVRSDDVPDAYETTQKELEQYYFTWDVDGLFTDFPDAAVGVLSAQKTK